MLDALEHAFADKFGRPPETVTAAPGRIEFIGNHTDYNGGLVLGAAIDRFVWCAAAVNPDATMRLASSGQKLVEARRPFARLSGDREWSNYPIGVLLSLEQEGLRFAPGYDLHFASDLPVGAGLSSSAAIELASAKAYLASSGHDLPEKTLILACQRAENQFVGVPCGMLDQAVSCVGRRDHLVYIDCTAVTFTAVPIPPGVHFWIFNTNKKHSLVDSLYGVRNRECRDAFARLQQRHPAAPNLSALTPAQVLAAEDILEPELFRRARHVVEENQRVRDVLAALERRDLPAIGQLLLASHESSRVLFENSIPELDLLVELLRDQNGVYGARLSGGGFGGAVMAMTDASFHPGDAEAVVRAYCQRLPGAPVPSVLHVQTGDGARRLK